VSAHFAKGASAISAPLASASAIQNLSLWHEGLGGPGGRGVGEVSVALGATVGFQEATLAATVGTAATLDEGAVVASVAADATVGPAVTSVAPADAVVVIGLGRASLAEHAESMTLERPMAAR